MKKREYILSILLHSIFALIGGMIYYTIEVIWRGYSHWTMFILGGICFVLIGILDEIDNQPIWRQMLNGAIIVTVLEFIFGVISNIILGWHIWDYSDMPLNLLGQVCLPFTMAWFFLSYAAIKMENYLHFIFDIIKEEILK